MLRISKSGVWIAACAAAAMVGGCASTPADVQKQKELAGMEKAGQRTDNSPIPPPTTVPQPK